MQGAARTQGGTPEVPTVRILRQQKVLDQRRNRRLDRIHQQNPAPSSVTALAFLKLTDPVHRFEGVNHIGAGADNDIVITDEYLSSRHAAIRYEDGRYEFKDNDSTNGSFLNEKRVTKDELIDNDTIRLGRTELRFKALY